MISLQLTNVSHCVSGSSCNCQSCLLLLLLVVVVLMMMLMAVVKVLEVVLLYQFFTNVSNCECLGLLLLL